MTVLGYERGSQTLAWAAKLGADLRSLVRRVRDLGLGGHRDARQARQAGRRLASVLLERLPHPGEPRVRQSARARVLDREGVLERARSALRATALEVLGPGAQLRRTHSRAATDVDWPRDFLWSRAESIFSGANEIQRNIIAKRVLACRRSESSVSGFDHQQLLRASTPFLAGVAARHGASHRGAGADGFEAPQSAAARRDGYVGLVVPAEVEARAGRRRARRRTRAGGPRLPAGAAPRRHPGRGAAGRGRAGSLAKAGGARGFVWYTIAGTTRIRRAAEPSACLAGGGSSAAALRPLRRRRRRALRRHADGVALASSHSR